MQDYKQEFNYGILVLRVLMCFEVVLCHCWIFDNTNIFLMPFDILRPYAVPVFMFMSFFLNQKSFTKRNKEYIKTRIYRLVVPQIVWASIYFIVYWTVEKVFKYKIINGVEDLLWQVVTGHSPALNATMWFQTDLIVLSIFFFCTFYFLRENRGILLILLLSVVCLLLQYSEINYRLWGSLRYEVAYPIGRAFETLPMATLGFVVSYLKLSDKLNIRKGLKIIMLFVSSIVCIELDRKYVWVSNDFDYSGVWKLFIGALVTVFWYNCNLHKVTNKYQSILKFVGKHTFGIYCCHRLVAFFVFSVVRNIGVEVNTFYQCICIYILSFVFCEMVSKIPFKFIKFCV